MIGLSISVDISNTERYLDKVQKQIPFAIAKSLTKTAQDIKKDERIEMTRVFDRPTRYTLNSLYVLPARKSKLVAVVKIKDEAIKGNAAVKYLKEQMEGGGRSYKGFEKLLISRGQMPSGMYAVPSRTMKLNKFGNVTNGMIQKILSGLGAQRDIYQRSRSGSKTHGKYFSGIVSGTHGIWDVNKLRKGLPALLFLFVKRPTYNRRFKFHAVAERTAKRMFTARFNHEMKRALATAR